MKILIANIGSTSLKWRLFDFSNGAEQMLHKGGFERVTDYPKAIEDCLVQLKEAGAIASENDLAAVGFKTVIAKNVTGCVRLDERGEPLAERDGGLAVAERQDRGVAPQVPARRGAPRRHGVVAGEERLAADRAEAGDGVARLPEVAGRAVEEPDGHEFAER